MATKTVIVFYAWQSDTPSQYNKNLIRKALDDAADRINADPPVSDVEVKIDSDTEGEVGTPHVTQTILEKIGKAGIFVPDLSFVASTEAGKLLPNANVMIEYGYALHARTLKAMMPVMNTHFGPPEKLPFDMGFVRHPIQYEIAPETRDGDRRRVRANLSERIEAVLREMIAARIHEARQDNSFRPVEAKRPPAFFFEDGEVLAEVGEPGEQKLRFKRERAVFVRLYPTSADQPRVGNAAIRRIIPKIMPMENTFAAMHMPNKFGAIVLVPQHGDGITGLTQAFATGELWGLSEKPLLWPERTEGRAFSAIGVEKVLVTTVENYLRVFENDFHLVPPFKLEVGIVGIDGFRIVVPSWEFPGQGTQAGPVVEGSLWETYQLQSFEKVEWMGALRDFAIKFYDLAAVDRAEVLTDQHIAANGLPPR